MKLLLKPFTLLAAAAVLTGLVPQAAFSATGTITNYYAEADLGSVSEFTAIFIDRKGGRAPEEYTVELSDDGLNWHEAENNSALGSVVSNMSFEAGTGYTYTSYNAQYVRVVSDEALDGIGISIQKYEDTAPEGTVMLFETNDGTDIRSTATENMDSRLNKKSIITPAYIYWNDAVGKEYNYDAVNIIIPLGARKEIASFEIGSYYNQNNKVFSDLLAGKYELFYADTESEVHGTDVDNLNLILSGTPSTSGRTMLRFEPVTATHLVLRLGGAIRGSVDTAIGQADGSKVTKNASFLTYIGAYTAGPELVKSIDYGSFDAEGDVPEYQGTVDLVMFMGQSNMAGRGTASDSIICPEGQGYEFRAISDPTKLYQAKEPFGINENNPSGVSEPGNKTGSMVSALMKSYYDYTEVPIVGVSCSIGGTSIDAWQPGTRYLDDAIARFTEAKKYLKNNGYVIRRRFMVWCQGESDGDKNTPIDEYKSSTSKMVQAMVDEGVEKCFMVRIGHYRDDERYDKYIEAQSELCEEDDNIVMASEKFADLRDLMKDVFHYTQEAYNITGADAGQNIAAYYGDTEKKEHAEPTIDIISKLKTDTEAGVTLNSGFEGQIAAGLYSPDGNLLDCRVIEDNGTAQTIKFDISDGNAKTIKLFNWDSILGGTSLSISVNIDINSIDIPNMESTNDFLYGEYSNDEMYEHSMPYRYCLPVNYDSTKEYPVLMYLHGAGGRGNDNVNHMNNPRALFDRMLNEENISKYPCILIAPQCPTGEQWVDTGWVEGSYSVDNVPISDELSMAKDIILEIENRFSVDLNRVYIAGQSMGGYGAWDIIMRNPDMFAAAIINCGAGDPSKGALLKDMAIWVHHGDADTTVPLSGSRDMVKAIKDAGSTNIRYTQYPGVEHEVQTETFKDPDLLNWLFSKDRETNPDEVDNYSYIVINDTIINDTSYPRPDIKEDGTIWVSARALEDALRWTITDTEITAANASMPLTSDDIITENSEKMIRLGALADGLGVETNFDELSGMVALKSSQQRSGALKIAKAEANDAQTENPVFNAIDGFTDTRWSAMVNNSRPENTFTCELAEEQTVSAVEIYFYAGDTRSYDFDIKVSSDGETWTTAGRYASTKVNGFERFAFKPVTAKYIQYCGRGSTLSDGSKNAYNSFWEFEIYGE